MTRHPTIRQVAEFLEAWAPVSTAQSYDNVGLQVGDPSAEVSRGLVALDMTPQILDEAVQLGASLIVTHHPLIFRPLRSVTTQSLVSSLAYRLVSSGIGLYSIHTNLDAAPGGVSFALGRKLGLLDMEFLDVFDSERDEIGFGAIGRMEEPISLRAFLEMAADRLDAASLRYVGDPDANVSHVAVCGGSGSDLAERAMEAGADVFLTADLKYHRFFDVLDVDGKPRMALVDAGHYETEALTEALLRDELSEQFPGVPWHRTMLRTNPISTFVPA